MAQNLSTTKIFDVPAHLDPVTRSFLQSLKSVVEGLQTTATPPQPPTNLQATPGPGQVSVSFTRSNAVNFRLYVGSSADRSTARIVDLGSNGQWLDAVGQPGVKRYYWVEAVNQTSISPLVGPVSATTLPLTTPAATVAPPPESTALTFDVTLNQNRPVIYGTDRVNMPRQSPLSED